MKPIHVFTPEKQAVLQFNHNGMQIMVTSATKLQYSDD